MKNILIICGSFPPQSFVGGLRPAMFAKYLPRYGWNPWVLTRDLAPDDPGYDEKMHIDFPDLPLRQITRVKYSLEDERHYLETRSFLKKIRDFFYPEYSSPPGIFFSVKNIAEEIIRKTEIDIIFTTSPDQWELTLGSYLANKYQIPLIADFRDIMEQEKGFKRSFRSDLHVMRFAFRRYITTRNASFLTTVSEYHKNILGNKLGKPCSIVYNGFDRSEFEPMSLKSKKDTFRIIYVGRILDTWYQNPELLFTAIDETITNGILNFSEISVEFYGTDKEKLIPIIKKLKNPEFIKFFDRIPYSEVPLKLNEAQMLLLLTNNGRKGILTTKFFEYTGVKKPILCVPGDQGELDRLICKYNLGYSISDSEALKKSLVVWLESYKAGTFPSHLPTSVEFFTRENQTKIFSEILNKISSSIL